MKAIGVGPLLALTAMLIVAAVAPAAELRVSADPPRTKRADAFLGIHFDFHAGDDCGQVGARTTPEMVERVIDKERLAKTPSDRAGKRDASRMTAFESRVRR